MCYQRGLCASHCGGTNKDGSPSVDRQPHCAEWEGLVLNGLMFFNVRVCVVLLFCGGAQLTPIVSRCGVGGILAISWTATLKIVLAMGKT